MHLCLGVCQSMLTGDRTDCGLILLRYARMRMDLLLVVSNRCFRHRAHIVLFGVVGARMVRRQHGCRSAYDWADLVVHGLSLGVLDSRLQRRAFRCDGRGGVFYGDGRVGVQVVVMVCGSADDGADLLGMLVGSRRK